MNYLDQLETNAWKQKRDIILTRDRNTCQNCFNKRFHSTLSSGFLMPFDSIYDRIDHFFVNVNLAEKQDFPTRVILRKSLYLSKFNKIPKFLWIDYMKDTDTNLANVYFIKEVNDEFIAEIKRLYNRNLKKEIPSMGLSPDPIKILKEERDLLMDKTLSLKQPLKEESGKKSPNPYFSERLLIIGQNLPISFAFCLNVHHKVYRLNKLAWEYPNDDLITLCWDCHEELHKNSKIKCIGKNNEDLGYLTPCSRCFGAGWFPEFKHVQDGICFRCRGARFDEYKDKLND